MSTSKAVVKPKKVVLESSDKEIFEVDEKVALQFQTIKHMIEDECADGKIPIANVTSHVLAMVIEYCQKHVGKEDSPKASVDDMKEFDEKFCNVEQEMLFDLIRAAHYLNINSLLDLTAHAVANMMKGKTPEDIRKTFNITNDFTKEEEDEIRRQNAWAFDE